MMETKYYSAKELMDIFKISRYLLYRASQSGALPIAKKEGNQNLYSEADVKRYIERSANGKIVNN